MPTRVYQGVNKKLIFEKGGKRTEEVRPTKPRRDINAGKTFADWEREGRGVYVYLKGIMPKVPHRSNMPIPAHVAEQMFWLCHSPSGQPRIVAKNWMTTREMLAIIFKNLKG